MRIDRQVEPDRHGHPRDDEHGLAGPGLRRPDRRGPALAPGHRHVGRRARTTSSAPVTSPSTRAARTGSAIAASWCSSPSHSRGGPRPAGTVEEDRHGDENRHRRRPARRLRRRTPWRSRSPTRSRATSSATTGTPTASSIETSDGREFTVKLTDTTIAQLVRNLGEPYTDATAQMRDMLVPGRYMFAYGVFYPEGGDARLRGQGPDLPGRAGPRLRVREAGLVGQADLADGRLLHARAVRRGRAELARVPGRHRHDRQQGRRPPGDGHHLPPGLRPRRRPTT